MNCWKVQNDSEGENCVKSINIFIYIPNIFWLIQHTDENQMSDCLMSLSTTFNVETHRVTSGAMVGRMFFKMAWIQLRRIPEVIADIVNAPSLLWEEDKQKYKTSVILLLSQIF